MNGKRMNENKEAPTVEYSLKSISWHLKTISEELKKLNESIKTFASTSKQDLF